MKALFALLVAIAGPATAAEPAKYIRADVIAASSAPRPGSTILVGIRMTPRPGWHGYWSNPGESGFAPSVRWSAPAGVTFGPLVHPAPTLLKVSGMTSFVHEGSHVLLARMTVPRSIARGRRIPVRAEVNWAACSATQCVPLRANFKLDLVAGVGAPSAHAAALRAAGLKLPRAAPNGRLTANRDFLRLRLPASLSLDPRRARFFPDSRGAFDAAGGRAVTNGGAVVISGPRRGAVPRAISGVVSDDRAAYRLTFIR